MASENVITLHFLFSDSVQTMELAWLWILVVAGIAVALLFPIVAGLPRVDIPRQPEPDEGFDDRATGAGYAEIQDRLEFRSIRRTVVDHVVNIIKKSALAKPLRIIDLGCGTGHLLKDLHDEIGSLGWDVSLHGIDIGAASIRECKEYLSRAGLRGIDIKEGDGAQMPVPDSTMDIVIASLSMHHWSKPETVLAEIHRVLRPGGRMVIFDLRRDARKFFHHAFNHWFTPRMPEPLKSAGDPYRSMLASYTPPEIDAMLKRTPWARERVSISPRSIALFVDGLKALS
ncbi:MAG: class I SAM-dependent methyltransferase [Candidatus Sigynarchaeota archaeon]